MRIAADAVEIDTLASHLACDRTVDAARGLRGLYLHMLMLLPLLASIEDRIAAIGDGLRTIQPALAHLLDDLASWVATEDREPQTVELASWVGADPAQFLIRRRATNRLQAQEKVHGIIASPDRVTLAVRADMFANDIAA